MSFRFACGLMALLFLSGSQAVYGQRPAHYAPSRPVLSPYFFYSAINTTGLPNYYTYVRPAIQFEAFLQRSNVMAGRADTRSRLTDGEVTSIVERQLRLRETTGAGAPALPGNYMDLSHFYGTSATGTRRR
ncbi:MAG: hypothetical protein AB7F89_19980 [Pirellulaceae bacterium]